MIPLSLALSVFQGGRLFLPSRYGVQVSVYMDMDLSVYVARKGPDRTEYLYTSDMLGWVLDLLENES